MQQEICPPPKSGGEEGGRERGEREGGETEGEKKGERHSFFVAGS